MNAGRDVERLIATWLAEEAPGRAPDRVLSAAGTLIDRTRQRRSAARRGLWIPWRLPNMFTNRVAVAALAIVLVVAGGGFALSRLAGPGTGGPSPTLIPSPTPSPIPSSPSASSLAITTSDVGKNLQAGTYRVDGFAVPFSVTLPPGWIVNGLTRNGVGIEKRSDGKINISLLVMDKVYPDPCHTEGGPTVVGSGVDALIAALSALPRFEVTDMKDANVGGAAGKEFKFGNSIPIRTSTCSGDMLPIGTYDNNGEDVDIPMFGMETDRFWVLDAVGTRILMAVSENFFEDTQEVRDGLSFGDGSTN